MQNPDLGPLTPPGPIESTALCWLFQQAPSSISCVNDGDGKAHIASLQALNLPLRMFLDPSEQQMLLGGIFSVPDDATAGFDLATDPARKGPFDSREQMVASRTLEHRVVQAGAKNKAILSLLAIRAYVFLVTQVTDRIAAKHMDGDVQRALNALRAKGFVAPNVSELVAAGPLDYRPKSTDPKHAEIHGIGLAYKAVFNKFLAAEARVPGTEMLPAVNATTPLTSTPLVGEWEPRVRATLEAVSGDLPTVSLPVNLGPFVFDVSSSQGLNTFLLGSASEISIAIQNSLRTLNTAWSSLAATLPTTATTTTDGGGGAGTDAGAGAGGAGAGGAGAPAPAPETSSKVPWGWIAGAAAAAGLVGLGLVLSRKGSSPAPAAAPPPAAPREDNPVRRAKIIANLGDVNFAAYGGTIVRADGEAEHLQIDEENGGGQLFRFQPEQLKEVGGKLVPLEYDASWPHPLHQYEPWFVKSLVDMARSVGMPVRELRDLFLSADPVERAAAYDIVGGYHGYMNLDSYPLTLTRKEVRSRFGRVGAVPRTT